MPKNLLNLAKFPARFEILCTLVASPALNYLKMLPIMPAILFLNHNTLVVCLPHFCLSNTVLLAFEKFGFNAAVVEAKNNAKNYEFSSIMCLFAVASALLSPITQ